MAQPAQVRVDSAAGQLLVDGKPYLIFGGELGNSSAGTAAQADEIFDMLMGDQVPPRKKFIQTHAKYVRNLDV